MAIGFTSTYSISVHIPPPKLLATTINTYNLNANSPNNFTVCYISRNNFINPAPWISVATQIRKKKLNLHIG